MFNNIIICFKKIIFFFILYHFLSKLSINFIIIINPNSTFDKFRFILLTDFALNTTKKAMVLSLYAMIERKPKAFSFIPVSDFIFYVVRKRSIVRYNDHSPYIPHFFSFSSYIG